MGKVIKVIDLLNMVANGEKMPEEIKYKGEVLEYNEATYDYEGILEREKEDFFTYLFTNMSTEFFINDEVEILDEELDEE